MIAIRWKEGGPTSGNFGHEGRPGLIGGSSLELKGLPDGVDKRAWDTYFNSVGLKIKEGVFFNGNNDVEKRNALEVIAKAWDSVASQNKEIMGYLQDIPIQSIHIYDEQSLENHQHENAVGLYIQKINTIVLAKGSENTFNSKEPVAGGFKAGEDFESTFLHELGHHVGLSLYPPVKGSLPVLRKMYYALKPIRQKHGELKADKVMKSMVSRYADTDYGEFFSEMFVFRYHSKADPSSYPYRKYKELIG